MKVKPMILDKLEIRPEIWLKYTSKAVRPWSEEAVKIDIMAIQQMKRTTEPMPTPNQLARRWGWPIKSVNSVLNQNVATALEVLQMSEVAPVKAKPKSKKRVKKKK